jgi:hypothetical protein
VVGVKDTLDRTGAVLLIVTVFEATAAPALVPSFGVAEQLTD